jgi:inactivated superfamily I helicase
LALNKNIFYVSNPAKILDGLWHIISESNTDLENILIFLPNRRAVRSVEKMIAKRTGGAAFLPRLVPLGEGIEDDDCDKYEDTVSELERVVALSYLISGLPDVQNVSAAIPIAHTLITMQDYLDNSGINISDIEWTGLIDDKYAHHFHNKAKFLDLLSRVNNDIFNGRRTDVQRRNSDVYAWCDYVKNMPLDSLVVVCGSTASVPVTRDLMTVIAGLPNGRIILPGKISGVYDDFNLDTNPYNSEYKFLSGIGVLPNDICELDVGDSHIDFMNRAFSNVFGNNSEYDLSNCHLIETNRESEEVSAIAEIANRAITNNQSVLVITPDAAGNQRLMSEFERYGIVADFSGGVHGDATLAGRAILNLFDDWADSENNIFDDIYKANKFNLFDTIAQIVDMYHDDFQPKFDMSDVVSVQIWTQIKDLSDCLMSQNIQLNLSDARSFVADSLSMLRIRPPMNDSAQVTVLGTIESRMQTADVVILMGLNEGMFPGLGYENPWLPRRIANEIGLPSPNHKVSLMALDFMNLSCGPNVYWTRSLSSGGVQTQESRFLSRVMVARGIFDKSVGNDVLDVVRSRDIVQPQKLDYSDPVPPADWSDVYVTELELLIHNPYAFYVRHILRLGVRDDYWVGPDARDFGNLVHGVLENAPLNCDSKYLINAMDNAAHDILQKNNLIFNFWHRRFVEIAPIASEMLKQTPNAVTEISGMTKIAGRNVRARADRIWDGGVLDIKTGAAPTKSQLDQGNMPQLPLEALILKNGGFPMYTTDKSLMPVIRFLQLKSGDARIIEYDIEQTDFMIRAAVDKVTELFNIYSTGGAGYKYLPTGEQKYKNFDDFARADERD